MPGLVEFSELPLGELMFDETFVRLCAAVDRVKAAMYESLSPKYAQIPSNLQTVCDLCVRLDGLKARVEKAREEASEPNDGEVRRAARADHHDKVVALMEGAGVRLDQERAALAAQRAGDDGNVHVFYTEAHLSADQLAIARNVNGGTMAGM